MRVAVVHHDYSISDPETKGNVTMDKCPVGGQIDKAKKLSQVLPIAGYSFVFLHLVNAETALLLDEWQPSAKSKVVLFTGSERDDLSADKINLSSKVALLLFQHSKEQIADRWNWKAVGSTFSGDIQDLLRTVGAIEFHLLAAVYIVVWTYLHRSLFANRVENQELSSILTTTLRSFVASADPSEQQVPSCLVQTQNFLKSIRKGESQKEEEKWKLVAGELATFLGVKQ